MLVRAAIKHSPLLNSVLLSTQSSSLSFHTHTRTVFPVLHIHHNNSVISIPVLSCSPVSKCSTMSTVQQVMGLDACSGKDRFNGEPSQVQLFFSTVEASLMAAGVDVSLIANSSNRRWGNAGSTNGLRCFRLPDKTTSRSPTSAGCPRQSKTVRKSRVPAPQTTVLPDRTGLHPSAAVVTQKHTLDT